MEFITSKQDDASITTANISVMTNKEFMHAVKSDSDFICRFPIDINPSDYDIDFNKLNYGELYTYNIDKYSAFYFKKYRARDIWDKLIFCAHAKAEPGILFWDTTLENDPGAIYDKLTPICVNPCGELALAAGDSCRLLSLNLSHYVLNEFEENAEIDLEGLYNAFYDAQVIGDDIVDLEIEYINRIIKKIKRDSPKAPEIEMWQKSIDIAKMGRRTGVGFMGLGDMYAMLGVNYGDKKVTEDVMRTMMRAQLDATIDMGIIRGIFDEHYLNTKWTTERGEAEAKNNHWYNFISTEFFEQYKKMIKFGRRNVTFSCIPPTGSISLIARTTSGIEPLFMPYYQRKVKVNGDESFDVMDADGQKFNVYYVIHPTLKKWIMKYMPTTDLNNEKSLEKAFKASPWYNNIAGDIDYQTRVETQALIQKYITSSISSTVNLPANTDIKTVEGIFMSAYDNKCKGITIYRDGCRQGVMASNISGNDKNAETNAKKRPEMLPCEIYRFTNNGEKWIACVGILDDRPYEIFTGKAESLNVPTCVDNGVIIKVKHKGESSRYDLRYVDCDGFHVTIEGINRMFNPEFWNYGKLLSALLRHGMGIQYIVETLNKMSFDNDTINSWRSGVVRSLKKWIKDGTKSGDKCPNCGETLTYENGCKTCHYCGYNAC